MAENIRKEAIEWLKALVAAALLAIVIRTFLIEPYRVDGSSMEPNLHHDERVFLNRLVYRLNTPKRRDVIVVGLPDEDISIIKRVMATEGEVIEVVDGAVWVDGNRLEEPYLFDETLGRFGPVQVPEGHVFVMGDNRQNSRDSRHISIGFVSHEQIKGKAVVVYWPITAMRSIAK